MKPTKAQIRSQLKKVNKLSCKHTEEAAIFDTMCVEDLVNNDGE